MNGPGMPRGQSGPPPESAARSILTVLYAVWGAMGASILMQFGLLLFLQRRGRVLIADSGGPIPAGVHVALVLALALAAALLALALRARLRDPSRLARAASRRGAGPDRTPTAVGSPGLATAGSSTRRDLATRFMVLSVLQWAAADGLAVVGLVLALALQPAPRLALTLYFTLALAIWVLVRPDPEALRRALGA